MRKYLIGAVVGLTLLAGCGGDSDEDSQLTVDKGQAMCDYFEQTFRVGITDEERSKAIDHLRELTDSDGHSEIADALEEVKALETLEFLEEQGIDDSRWDGAAQQFGQTCYAAGWTLLPGSIPKATDNTPNTAEPEARPSTEAGAYAFGDTYFGKRGNITVSEPKPWDPPSWQGTPEGKRWLAVTVTVENSSNRVQDGYNWSFEATANGRSIYASEPGNGVPDILPGRTGTWKVTFKLPESRTDLVFSIAYGLFDSIYWAGQTPTTRRAFQTFTGDIFTVSLLDTASTAAKVRFCATALYQGGSIPVTRSPWSLQDQHGTPWPADDGPGGLPGKAYPIEAIVNVGDCLQGWIQFDAPPSTTPSGVVYHSDIGGPFNWDLNSTGTNTAPALPSETPAETEAGWNLPKGFPKVVEVSSLPDQIRNWYQISGNKEAVAVAPGVWAELPPGATVADVFEAGVFEGFCASITAFERQYMAGAQTAGTCW